MLQSVRFVKLFMLFLVLSCAGFAAPSVTILNFDKKIQLGTDFHASLQLNEVDFNSHVLVARVLDINTFGGQVIFNSAASNPLSVTIDTNFEMAPGNLNIFQVYILELTGNPSAPYHVLFQDSRYFAVLAPENAGPQGPPGPNLVDEFTHIEPGVIQYHHLNENVLENIIDALEERYFLIPKTQGALVLWNKLENASLISEIGPNGTTSGNYNFNNDGKFGKGFTPNSGYNGTGVDFPSSLLDPNKGTIEFWTVIHSPSVAFSHGIYGFVNTPFVNGHEPIVIYYIGEGNSINVEFRFGGTYVDAKYSNFSPPLGVPIHVRVVWDRNGIDGTSETIRVYVNGNQGSLSPTQNNWGTNTSVYPLRIGTTWDSSFTEDRYTIDNIKIYTEAITDFSNIDME